LADWNICKNEYYILTLFSLYGLSMAEKKGNISNKAVESATGRNWSGWFELLDANNCDELTHKEIVAYLRNNSDLNGWWQQMVTNTYEQEKGIRNKHEMPDGYQISASKSIKIPVHDIYEKLLDAKFVGKWLDGNTFEIRLANKNKNIRINWEETDLEIQFFTRDTNKTQVTIQERKIYGSALAETKKEYWKEKLVLLKAKLED